MSLECSCDTAKDADAKSCILHSTIYSAYPGVAWQAIYHLLCKEMNGNVARLYQYLEDKGWMPVDNDSSSCTAASKTTSTLSRSYSSRQVSLLSKVSERGMTPAPHRKSTSSLMQRARRKLGRHARSNSFSMAALRHG